jgi:AcrR family transcriptional regulator
VGIRFVANDLLFLQLFDLPLRAFTFRRLIDRFDVKVLAIYWRFESKQELLDAVAEAILQEYFANFTPKDMESWGGSSDLCCLR